MNVYRNIDSFKKFNNSVITIGTFDGVHIGHQKILKILNEEAENVNGESILFTFHPHPKMVVDSEGFELKMLQTLDERLDKLSKFNLNNTLLLPFTKEFSEISAEDFLVDFLIGKLNLKKIIIGYDHKFGKNRTGDIHFLKQYAEKFGYEVVEIPAQEINDVNVSSTKIRKYIENGQVELANDYLGDYFEINGKVIEGDKIGRTIGFPTANIYIEEKAKIIPSNGVYLVKIHIENDEKYGMLNIGVRPTINNQLKQSIEVHLFDFNKDVYQKEIKIQFLKRIRDEQKFDSLEFLIKQLKKDETVCRNLLLTI